MGGSLKPNSFYTYYNLSDQQKFIISSIYMDGLILSWYQWMHLNILIHSYTRFKIDLLRRFCPSLYKDISKELAKLQQKTTK